MFIVQGGIPLQGTVTISGAKNAALPIMAATLAASGTTRISRVPRLVDVETLSALLRSLGMRVTWTGPDELELNVQDDQNVLAHYDLVRKMRAGVCVLGPLLAKRGRACVSLPGGCNIGERPIDLHLKGLAALGAEIRVEKGYVVAQAKRLRGARINMSGPFGTTVTGTCNVMMAATLAEGQTVIEAAACEPEIVDLGNCLNRMGANIEGLGSSCLRIDGVRELRGCEHTLIPDRIEAATLMIAAAITRGEIELHGVSPNHLTAIIQKLAEIGVRIDSHDAEILQISARTPLKSVECVAQPYPGIPTDVQAQLMALLCTVPGISVITEKVFPDRFMHMAELARMGASLRREGTTALINGSSLLSGACVMASDLRASAALVLAALAAEGESVIRRIYHLDRGYDRLDEKLSTLGAKIQRVPDKPEFLPQSLSPTIEPIAQLEQRNQAHGVPQPHWHLPVKMPGAQLSSQDGAQL
ncbi:MAG: UDP-N-acetylglucosamine 1-carboxyvinyltransferase [Planctomycetales bacterium]